MYFEKKFNLELKGY
jgi:hypothetical protein